MTAAGERPCSVLADGESAAPAFVVDVVAGAIVQANAAGWAFWGLDAATVAPPFAVDCAMPALQSLRMLACGNADGTRHERLTLWTARGVAHLVCRVQAIGEAMTARFAIQVPYEPGEDAASTVERAPVHAIDIALPARLAHELRTPLGAVIAYAEILKDGHFGSLANPRYQGYAKDIYDSARHALSVVDGMLQGNAERSVVPPLAFADLDPAGVVASCIAVARPLADRAGLALDSAVEQRLPRIVADELSLKQMLLNLLANAIKFARRGDRVTVSVAYQLDGPLCISVVDTGPGMAHAAGRAADGAARPTKAGLGLGLPLTRALAAANGAVLAITSELGRGTSVTISFGKDRVVPV